MASWFYDLTLMVTVHQLMATGVTGTAVCTALNKSILETWLYGVNSYQYPKVVEQQFEQAHRWFRRGYRDMQSPEKHIGSNLAKGFFPGPCGMCPACALKLPATAKDCECNSPEGWTAEYKSSLVSNINSQHRARAAAIVADVKFKTSRGASTIPGMEGVPDAAVPSDTAAAVDSMVRVPEASLVDLPCNLTNLFPAGEDIPQNMNTKQPGNLMQQDITQITFQPSPAQQQDKQRGPQGGVQIPQQSHPQSHTPSAALQTTLLQQQPHLQQLQTQHLPDSSSIQPCPSQHQDGYSGAWGADQHPHQPPVRTGPERLALTAAVPQPQRQHRCLGSTSESTLPMQASQSSQLVPAWLQSSHSQMVTYSQQGLTQQPVATGSQSFVLPAAAHQHLHGSSTSQHGYSHMTGDVASQAAIVPTSLTITSPLGHYSVEWPLIPRFFYIISDGNFKLTHYANTGTEHTAAVIALNAAVPYGKFFSSTGDHMYELCKGIAKRGDAAALVQVGEPGSSGSGPSSEFEPTCQAELLAARSQPPKHKTANTDVKVVVGCVCPHVVSTSGF